MMEKPDVTTEPACDPLDKTETKDRDKLDAIQALVMAMRRCRSLGLKLRVSAAQQSIGVDVYTGTFWISLENP